MTTKNIEIDNFSEVNIFIYNFKTKQSVINTQEAFQA